MAHVCFMSVEVSVLALEYVVCLCRRCDGCCVFYLFCEAWSCRCSCIREVSVSRHTCVVGLCLVYIQWQSSMLRSA